MKRLEYRIQGFKSCLLRSWNLWQIQAYFLSGLVMKTQNHRWIIIAKGGIKFQISNEILSQHTNIAFISVLAFSHTDPSLHFHDEVLFKYSTAAELRRIQNLVKHLWWRFLRNLTFWLASEWDPAALRVFIAVRNATKKVVSTVLMASKYGVGKGGKPFERKHFWAILKSPLTTKTINQVLMDFGRDVKI